MKWHSVPLEDLSVKRGGSVNPEKFPDETFELFSIPAFDTGKAEVCKGKEIGSAKKCVEPNDVLLSRIVPHIRRSWVVGESLGYRQIASGEWIQFRSDNVFPQYLKYFLISDPFHKLFMSTVSGVGGSLLRARPSEVYKIEIPLPPLPEQKRIAAILDAADALRTQRRQSIAELDLLLQSTFLEMFGDPVENPKGWKPSTIGDLIELKHGYAFKSEDFLPDGKYVLLTPGNFQEKGGFKHQAAKQKYCNDPVPNAFVLKSGDLLIAMTEQSPGLLGSPIITPNDTCYLHNQRLGKVVKNVEIETSYIFYLMNTSSIRNRIQQDSTGTKVKHTSPSKIAAIAIGVPPINLQKNLQK